MVRIAGIDLPNKQMSVALTRIYGIGRSSALEICAKIFIEPSEMVGSLSSEGVGRLRMIIEDEYKVEGRLRGEVALNIKRLMDIGCYRGIRHRKNLPVRGQRTRTNSRTRKGKRKTVANKKR